MKKIYFSPLIHEIGMIVEAGSALSNGSFTFGFSDSTHYESIEAED